MAAALIVCPPMVRAQSCNQFLYCTNISVPCEGAWGAHVSFAVVATNFCSTAQPTITYSQPPGSVFLPGTTTVCATSSIPGAVSAVCCFNVTVDTCCGTNCIKLVCPPDFVFPCGPTAVGNGVFVDLTQPQFKPTLTNFCGGPVPTSIVVGCSPSAPAGSGPTFFPPGENTVICCATNFAVQPPYIDCCCYKIFVLTNCVQTSPTNCHVVVICPTNVLVCATNGVCSTNVPFLVPTFFDSCQAGQTLPTQPLGWTTPQGSCFPLGKTTVGVCARWIDDRTIPPTVGTNCCCYDVIVTCCTNCDSVMKCPPDMFVTTCPGPNGYQLIYTAFGANPCIQGTFLDCLGGVGKHDVALGHRARLAYRAARRQHRTGQHMAEEGLDDEEQYLHHLRRAAGRLRHLSFNYGDGHLQPAGEDYLQSAQWQLLPHRLPGCDLFRRG